MDRAHRVEWFRRFAHAVGIPLDPELNLVAEVKVSDGHVQTIKAAAARYINACFGSPDDHLSEEVFVERLDRELQRLANRTPNGILLPKREFVREFNRLHQSVAAWFSDLNLDSLVFQLFCPVTVRIVKGVGEATVDTRPYASTKLHADLWTGEPADNVMITMPIFGDIGQTSVEFYHPPANFEQHSLRLLKDFDEGRELADRCRRYPIHPRLGYAYFFDAVVLHKTVKHQGQSRVSIQFALRRLTSEADRQRIERLAGPGRMQHYIDPREWFAFGTSQFMLFHETYADVLRGIFTERPYDQPSYEVVNSLS